jgi:hypothetical protein
MKTILAPVRIYDSGPACGVSDRYTAFYGDVGGFALSADADEPDGICLWIEIDEDECAGRIPLAKLPESAQRALLRKVKAVFGPGTEVLELIDDPEGHHTEAAQQLRVTAPGPRSRPSALSEQTSGWITRVAVSDQTVVVG